MASNLNDAQKLLQATGSIAANFDHSIVLTEHILLALVTMSNIKPVLVERGYQIDSMVSELTRWLQASSNVPPITSNKIQYTSRVDALFQKIISDPDFTMFHVLKEIGDDKTSVAGYFIEKYQIDTEELLSVSKLPIASNQEAIGVLEEFCTNLNQLAQDGKIDPLIGRTAELKKLTKVLAKRSKKNVILVGPAGVGKTSIVEGLALNIVNGRVPDHIKNETIWSLNIGDIVAGSKYRGEFEEKVKNIFAALKTQKNAILFISEVHQIKGAGRGSGSVDFANMIKPALARGEVKLIADTTWDEYTKDLESDAALMRRCTMIRVEEPSPAEAKLILKGLRARFEQYHDGTITDEAIEAAVDYSVKYITNRQLPDKAIDLIDNACAQMTNNGQKNWTIGREEVAAEVTADRGIKVDDITQAENPTEIFSYADRLKDVIFQQEEQIDTIAKSLVVWKSGLKDPNQPIANLMLLGSSGIGKTFLSKQLAELLHMNFLHYHMAEYQEKHSLATLIGAPPGYVGHGDGKAGDGILINDIIKHPNSVILFDEMAGKAHPDLANILMSMADEGKVVSMSGREADCKNCIIIITGNLGAREADIRKNVGFNAKDTKNEERKKAVDDFFLPELQGRFTILTFDELTPINLRRIIVRELKKLETTRPVLQTRKLSLLPSEQLIDHVMEFSGDKRMGARPYKNYLKNLILVPLGTFLLQNPAVRDATVNLDWDGELKITQDITHQELSGNIA